MSYKLSAINKNLTDITHNSLIFLKATHNAKLPMPVRDKYALIYDEHTSSNDITGWPLILVKGTQVLPNQSANIINLNPELNYIGEDDDIIPNPRFEVREKLDSFTSQFMKSIEVEGDDD